MKAERRHELKESDLAHALERGGNYLKQNGGRIGLLVIVVVAAVVVGNVVIQARENAVANNWSARLDTSLFDAPEGEVTKRMDALLSLAAESTDPEFKMSTLMEVGREGLRLAVAEKEVPDQAILDVSRKAFARLQAEFSNTTLAVGAAHFGLAIVEENEFTLDGDISHKTRAREHLQAIIDDESMHRLPIYQQALDRMDRLDEIFTSIVFAPPALPQAIPADQPPAADDGMAKPLEVRPVDPQDLPESIRQRIEQSGTGQPQIQFEPAEEVDPANDPEDSAGTDDDDGGAESAPQTDDQ